VLPDARQKKSGGTTLLGSQIVLGSVSADRSLLPGSMMDDMTATGADRVGFFETGPSVGCAYQFVIGKHFYLMASLTGILAFGTVLSEGETRDRTSSFLPNLTYHTFAGYHPETWAISR